MKPSIRNVDDLLGWGTLSELDQIILVIGAIIMRYRRVVGTGLIIALVLVIWWGVARDPLVLAAGLTVGFVTGLVAWLLK
jgi:hypothetical protein